MEEPAQKFTHIYKYTYKNYIHSLILVHQKLKLIKFIVRFYFTVVQITFLCWFCWTNNLRHQLCIQYSWNKIL